MQSIDYFADCGLHCPNSDYSADIIRNRRLEFNLNFKIIEEIASFCLKFCKIWDNFIETICTNIIFLYTSLYRQHSSLIEKSLIILSTVE